VAGVLAYDFARPLREPAPTPLLIALAVERFEVFENGARLLPARRPDASGDPALDRAALEALGPAAGAGLAGGARRAPSGPIALADWSSLSPGRYRSLVLRLKQHIARGDIYQANLSQRFRLPWPHGGLRLYDALRRISPAPFAGYMRAAGVELACSSPERLLLVDGDRLASRPIAGTRPRAADAEHDRRLAAELMLSEKERAEHLMLVDLVRNDLGRVAEIGSVEVDELMGVEEYSHVRHIVSNVRARLCARFDAFDALQALFPGGTITGVPKIRCMQILDALEPVPRGLYTGALFYATPSGRLDANILIRSAVVADGSVSFHAGGGIVADSDPGSEYAETLHKAEAIRLALEAALARARA
jgi:anthranilate/para-aminobenzoate synthase component I